MKAILITILIILSSHLSWAKEKNDVLQIKKQQMLQKYVTNISKLKKNNNNIIGIELIVAASSGNSLVSSFGHAMLRFVDNDIDPFNDIVVSFVANTNGEKVDYIKGIDGSYPVLIEALNYEDRWNQYVRLEGRSLKRYIIPTTKNNRLTIINNLSNNKNGFETKQYSFFKNNCAKVLVDLLKSSGISIGSQGTIYPKRINWWLHKNMYSPYPAIESISIWELIKKANQTLNLNLNELFINQEWPIDSAQKLISIFSSDELILFIQEVKMIPLSLLLELKSYFNENKISLQRGSLDKVYGLQIIPNSFYHFCKNEQCARNILKIEESVWDVSILKQKRNIRKTLYWGNFFNKNNGKDEKAFDQIEFLVKNK